MVSFHEGITDATISDTSTKPWFPVLGQKQYLSLSLSSFLEYIYVCKYFGGTSLINLPLPQTNFQKHYIYIDNIYNKEKYDQHSAARLG